MNILTRKISIHAPPRGATDAYKQQVETEKKFQFTPLREGRLLRSCTYHLQSNFNSRPSARGDGRTWYADYTYGEFQFTPLREGRRQKICNFCKSFVQPLQISMA